MAKITNKKAWDLAYKNRGLIGKVIKDSFSWLPFNAYMGYADYYQAGYFGLFTAAKMYDPKKGAFSTYACRWIYQKISRAFRNESFKTVRIPCQTYDDIAKIRKKHPHDFEDVILRGVKPHIKKAYRALQPSVELDALTEDGVSHSNYIEHPTDERPAIEENEMRDHVRDALATLTPRERDIIRLHYGIGRGEGLSFKKIADRKKINPQQVVMIERSALRKIKEFFGGKYE